MLASVNRFIKYRPVWTAHHVYYAWQCTVTNTWLLVDFHLTHSASAIKLTGARAPRFLWTGTRGVTFNGGCHCQWPAWASINTSRFYGVCFQHWGRTIKRTVRGGADFIRTLIIVNVNDVNIRPDLSTSTSTNYYNTARYYCWSKSV